MKLVNVFYQLYYVTFSKNKCWSVSCALLFLPTLLRSHGNFITCVKINIKVGICSKKLHTRNYFFETSCDYINDAICRPHLSWSILNVNFQLKP